jgi:hypothetical protein
MGKYKNIKGRVNIYPTYFIDAHGVKYNTIVNIKKFNLRYLSDEVTATVDIIDDTVIIDNKYCT